LKKKLKEIKNWKFINLEFIDKYTYNELLNVLCSAYNGKVVGKATRNKLKKLIKIMDDKNCVL
jgi:hypothetical protein